MYRVLMFLVAAGSAVSCMDGLPSRPPANVGTTTIDPVTFDAVYVVNGEDATISVINAETSTVASTLALRGAAYPHQIALSADRSLLGVAVPGYDMSYGEYGHEHHSARPGQVLLLDAVTGELKGMATTDASNNNVVFAPNGSELWTSQATNPGSTLILDVKSLAIREAISIGRAPTQTTFSTQGTLAYVPNSGSATVSVIDVQTRRLRATIPVGAGPVLAVPSKEGRVYVENEPDRTISVVDEATLKVTNTFHVDFVLGSLTVADSGELWITAPERGEVEIHDRDGNLMSTIAAGGGAYWVTFSPDGTRAYVSNQWDNTVTVIDRATKAPTATIPVGAKPNGMVWRSR